MINLAKIELSSAPDVNPLDNENAASSWQRFVTRFIDIIPPAKLTNYNKTRHKKRILLGTLLRGEKAGEAHVCRSPKIRQNRRDPKQN